MQQQPAPPCSCLGVRCFCSRAEHIQKFHDLVPIDGACSLAAATASDVLSVSSSCVVVAAFEGNRMLLLASLLRSIPSFRFFAGMWTDMNEVANFCDGRCRMLPADDLHYPSLDVRIATEPASDSACACADSRCCLRERITR